MTKLKLFIFTTAIIFLTNANPSLSQTICEELQCLDYKGRVINNSICNSHIAVIGNAPNTITCPAGCGSTACASPPSCSQGMTSIITGKDANDCNTYLCVSETCTPKPACTSGSADYKGLDSNNCPMWLCSDSAQTTPKPAGCPPKPNCRSNERLSRSGQTQVAGQICWRWTCTAKAPLCYEGPTSCSAGYRKIVSHTNKATGCKVRKCFPPCPTPTCPAGQFVKMKSTNGGLANGYCRNWSCSKTKPATTKPSGPTTTPSTPKPSGPTTTPSTPKPTGPITSCPAKPSCGSGKTLKNNGKNAIGCTSWTCVAQSCPSAPTCSGGKTLKSTGKDSNGCTTYQCVN